MVVFGLCGRNKSAPSVLKNNEVDVLDELMDLNNRYTRVNGNNTSSNTYNDLDTSSFNLKEIMNRVSTGNNNECINYKDALINSLYSQVEHLRGESLRKDRIIEYFMNNKIISPIKPVAQNNNSSYVEDIPEISNPQENPFFNDYCGVYDSVNKSNCDTRSLYSDISTSPLSTSAADVNITTNTCFEDYDRQLANYRYKHHCNIIEKKRKANYDPATTNVQFCQSESKRIKVALERLKKNIKNTDVNNEGKPSNNNDDIETIHDNNTNQERDALHVYNGKTDNRILWKKGTTLIVGDSMLNGLDESHLRNCKVRVYPGSSIEDMNYNIIPLLRKRPSTVILHIGTNNTTRDNSHQIIEKLKNLKQFILSQIPDVRLIISSLIQIYDDDKAQLTSDVTNTMLNSVSSDIINNDNISRNHLGKRGHHMTPYGTGRLAMNIIKVLKSL